jgi:hypothetical protein
MTEYNYPAELLDVLRTEELRLSKIGKRSWPPEVMLPRDTVLKQLLDVCYHASFLREEGRSLSFQIAFCTKEDLSREPNTRRSLVEFTRGVDFTPQQIRRLAPAIDSKQTTIAVKETSVGDETPRLEIWGLILANGSWAPNPEKNLPSFSPLPALIIGSSDAGSLEVSWKEFSLGRLEHGAIASRVEDILRFAAFGDFFVPAVNEVLREVWGSLDSESEDDRRSVHQMAWDMYMRPLKQILKSSSRHGHGGTILMIAQNEIGELEDNVSVRIKYGCLGFNIWNHILALGRAERAHWITVLDDFRPQDILVRQQDLDQWSKIASRELNVIGNLTAIDGAVLLTDHFDLVGFGVEIHLESVLKSIDIAPTQGKLGRTVPIEEYGTRHRSAFRFAEKFERTVAFVLSQDGGIKAVRQKGERVMLWTDVYA